MANEIYLSSNPGPADFVAAGAAARMGLMMLASRYSLRNAPFLVRMGEDLVGVSGGYTVSLWKGMGGDLMSSVAENADVANVALTTDQLSMSVADYGLAREVSDKARRRDPTGWLRPDVLAMDGVASAGVTLTSLIAQAVDGGTQVGSTGVAMTHDTFLAAQFALEQSYASGPYACMLAPKQFTDWQADLESRGGLTQWRAASVDMQQLRGEGFKGEYNGITVLTSGQVQGANANADWAGAMWGAGAVLYQEEPQAAPVPGQLVVLDVAGQGGVVIRVCAERDERGRMTSIITHYTVGVTMGESGTYRTIISKQ